MTLYVNKGLRVGYLPALLLSSEFSKLQRSKFTLKFVWKRNLMIFISVNFTFLIMVGNLRFIFASSKAKIRI